MSKFSKIVVQIFDMCFKIKYHSSIPGVPKNCLISCQLKTTVVTRSVFIFSKLSLKFWHQAI